MAVTTTLIKNDRQRAVAHIIATAAADVSTINLVDLRRSDELTSSVTSNLTVNITAAYCNVTDADSGITIKRGSSAVVLDMHGISEYPGTNNLPSLAIENQSSIVVTFQKPGMCILDLRKIAGFEGPNTNVGV